MRTEDLCKYGTIKLVHPGADLLVTSMDSSFLGADSYPEFIESVYGESGAIKHTRIICIQDDIKQRYDLAILYEQGAKFNKDPTTLIYMAKISKNIDTIKKEYLVSKL